MIEGKLVNQFPKTKIGQTRCECCTKIIPEPSHCGLKVNNEHFSMRSYIRTEYFIYESKSGFAVVYCSDWCRRKHNHRFK